MNLIGRFHQSAQDHESSRNIRIAELQSAVEDIVYPLVVKRKGSLSAEHGVGQQKRRAMAMTRSSHEVAAMQAIKMALDPNNTLNPGKVL